MAKTMIMKESVLALAAAAAYVMALFLWKEAIPLLQTGIAAHAGSFAAPAAALVLAASLFLLGAVLITTDWVWHAAVSIAVAAPFLLSPPPLAIAPIVPASVLLAFFAGRRMRREYELSLGFSTSKVARVGLPLFFTVASFLAAYFYFQTTQDQQRAAATLIPQPVTNLMIRVLAEPLKEATGLAEIRADMTVDELLAASIRKELGKSGVALSRDGERGITELLAHQRDAFARQYGITLHGNERVGDALHRAVIERLEAVLGPFVAYLPLVSALVFFFAFKAFTYPLYLMSIALAALLIRLLIAATLIKSESRQIAVQRLTL